jgi:hypothetical protein
VSKRERWDGNYLYDAVEPVRRLIAKVEKGEADQEDLRPLKRLSDAFGGVVFDAVKVPREIPDHVPEEWEADERAELFVAWDEELNEAVALGIQRTHELLDGGADLDDALRVALRGAFLDGDESKGRRDE